MRAPLRACAQKFLHHVVMGLRPIPGRVQRPAVDDVADEIDRVGVVIAQEVEEAVGLAAAGAEMHVGNKQRAKPPRGAVRHDAAIFLMLGSWASE